MSLRLWTIPLEQPAAAVDALAETLDEAERDSAGARANTVPRDRYVIAHGAVRQILGAMLGTAPRRLRIQRRCVHCGDMHHGKPVIDGAPPFSLSHSHDVAVLAISNGGNVGVDVEARRPRARLDRLAARVLSERELAQWSSASPEHQLDAFLRAWTAKEAYLKALGLGLVRPLLDVPVEPEGWTVLSYAPSPGALASVAVEGGEIGTPEVAMWTPDGGITLAYEW
jgi:4'-phosphopantetheinyl transferase